MSYKTENFCQARVAPTPFPINSCNKPCIQNNKEYCYDDQYDQARISNKNKKKKVRNDGHNTPLNTSIVVCNTLYDEIVQSQRRSGGTRDDTSFTECNPFYISNKKLGDCQKCSGRDVCSPPQENYCRTNKNDSLPQENYYCPQPEANYSRNDNCYQEENYPRCSPKNNEETCLPYACICVPLNEDNNCKPFEDLQRAILAETTKVKSSPQNCCPVSTLYSAKFCKTSSESIPKCNASLVCCPKELPKECPTPKIDCIPKVEITSARSSHQICIQVNISPTPHNDKRKCGGNNEETDPYKESINYHNTKWFASENIHGSNERRLAAGLNRVSYCNSKENRKTMQTFKKEDLVLPLLDKSKLKSRGDETKVKDCYFSKTVSSHSFNEKDQLKSCSLKSNLVPTNRNIYPSGAKPCQVWRCTNGQKNFVIENLQTVMEPNDIRVKVAARIRPQSRQEIIDSCRISTTCIEGSPQVFIGSDNAFTYDFVFGTESSQEEIFKTCVEPYVSSTIDGYNATILAYGQTGAGKTFTMGSDFNGSYNSDVGIIPRVIQHIFCCNDMVANTIFNDTESDSLFNKEFNIAVQYLELHNEDIVDLLEPYSKKNFQIHEDSRGQIFVKGVTIKSVQGPKDALRLLHKGASVRTTAPTQMNNKSSRSHSIFTLYIHQKKQILNNNEDNMRKTSFQSISSKFHLVDLAGSERLTRTGATGERFREGVAINCGLLALGNCISALADSSRRNGHIPYRDSKLTRILQDSLGGNSNTLMIACVSPNEKDIVDTINTLKYANRARKIKNCLILKQNQVSPTISRLQEEIAALKKELLQYKQASIH